MRIGELSVISDRILLALVAIFLFSSSVSGTAGSIFGGAAAIVFVVSSISFRRSFNFAHLKWFYLTVSLFVGWMILSALIAGIDSAALRAMRHEWIFALVPVVVFSLKNEHWSRHMVSVFAYGAGLMSLYSIGQFFWGWHFLKPGLKLEQHDFGYWIVGNFSGSVTFGIYFAVAAMFLIGYGLLGTKESNDRSSSISLVGGLLATVAAVLSAERGPTVAIVATLLVLVVLVRTRKVVTIFAVSVTTVVVVGLVSGVFARAGDLWKKELSMLHDQGRLFIWTQSYKVASDNPIFGVGPGNFENGYNAVLPTEPAGFVAQGHAHNDFLMYAAQSGFPELIFFLLTWTSIIWLSWRAYNYTGGSENTRRLALGAVLGSTCFFATSMFDIPFGHSTTRQLLMFVWGAGIAAYLAYRKTASVGTD